MQYRIIYFISPTATAEIIIVDNILAVHAMIDYANKWNGKIFLIECRNVGAHKWNSSGITQND